MGAEAGAGRTTIALYLALAAASLGQRVLLVDASLREPGLHTALGIANTSGVGELLAGTTPHPYWQGLLQQHSERLWVLTAGQGSGRLSSEVGVALLQEMKAAFDWVILDTPPQLTDSETNRLLTVVDGALLVLRLNHTEREAFTNVCKDYSLSFPNKLLGIVVNGAPPPKTTAKREQESDIPADGLRQPVSV
ncbi:MAG: CpsD/CapB family tyrosine-protein kinase [Thermosynechococcus sp.]